MNTPLASALALLLLVAHPGGDDSPLALDVRVSRTANLFHIVDQLSAWDPSTHAQYREHIALSDEDRRELARHAEIRKRHGWGGGLEQTFYVVDDLDVAIARGIAEKHLSPDEATAEREILTHFASRIDALLAAERDRLEAFRKMLDARAPELREFAGKVSRFCRGRRINVPVFLIADPSDDSLGGGYNGSRLVLEVAHRTDAYPTFLHELMHAFVNPDLDALEKAAAKAEGLDPMTLSEGLAYALAPGIYHAEGSDLDIEVARDIAEKRTIDDTYARFHRYGLALRPLLREALEDPHATLESFLPRALDAWKVMRALESVKRPSLTFSAGPAYVALSRRVGALHSFNHSAEHYREVLATARPGETFVLLYALDHPDRAVPPGFDDLLPRPWSEIEPKLRAGETVELTGDARKLHVVLLAAPTVKALEKVIAETRTLSP